MDFQVLGPVEVLEGDSRLDLGGRKQRTVLSVLIANVGQPTSTDSLIEATYGDDASDGSRHSIQTFISNLRGRLGDVIVSRGHSYELRPDGSTFDFIDFGKQVEDARTSLEADPARSADLLRRALAMWRGHPFQDVDGGGVLDLRISHLNELRLAALEARIQADLALGQHRQLVGELSAMTSKYPFRETFHAHYMLALYRCGRQADALRAYQSMCRYLAEELGIDPSPAVRHLEQRILEQDPTLLGDGSGSAELPSFMRLPRGAGPVLGSAALHELELEEEPEIADVVYLRSADELAGEASPGIGVRLDAGDGNEGSLEDRPSGRPPARNRILAGIQLVLVAAVLAASIVVGAVFIANAFGTPDPAEVSTTLTTPPRERSPLATDTTQFGTPPTTPTPAAESRSVPDPPDPQIVRTVTLGKGPRASFADDSGVWFTLTDEAALARVDPDTLVVSKVAVGESPTIPLVLGDQIWVPGRRGGALTVVDKNSLEVVATIQIGERLDTPVLAAGLVWITARTEAKLVAVDPISFAVVDEFELPGWPLTPVFAQGGLWVVGRDNGVVTRVDPFARAITEGELTVGSGPFAPILVEGEIWISDRADGTITIIDALRRQIAQIISIGGSLSEPVLVDGQVWISDIESRTVVVVDVELRQVIDRIETGLETTNPAAHLDSFWAADPQAGIIIRIDPARGSATQQVFVGGEPGVPLSAFGRLWVPDAAGTTVTLIE